MTTDTFYASLLSEDDDFRRSGASSQQRDQDAGGQQTGSGIESVSGASDSRSETLRNVIRRDGREDLTWATAVSAAEPFGDPRSGFAFHALKCRKPVPASR